MGITIHARLYASLRKWNANPVIEFDAPAGISVREAIAAAGVPEHEVAIIMLNGKRGKLEEQLADGDDIQLFPAIGGG